MFECVCKRCGESQYLQKWNKSSENVSIEEIQTGIVTIRFYCSECWNQLAETHKLLYHSLNEEEIRMLRKINSDVTTIYKFKIEPLEEVNNE